MKREGDDITMAEDSLGLACAWTEMRHPSGPRLALQRSDMINIHLDIDQTGY
jgi:hypothetical protein